MNALLYMLLVLANTLRRLYFAIRGVRIMVYRWFTESLYRTMEFNVLVRTLARMNKTPKHLIVLGEYNMSVQDCVRIIGWCITLDIPYISFFDHNGFFKENEVNLKDEFVRKQPDLIEHIIWNPDAKALSQNRIIGSKSKINVSLLSDVDSKQKIVTLTKSLFRAVSSGDLDPENITEELITEGLELGIPDPDLALIYGYICSTHGVLPWHTRTTEFFMLPSVSVKDFSCALERYDKCEQRHGI